MNAVMKDNVKGIRSTYVVSFWKKKKALQISL
jgi:hypothetical protein